MKGLIALGLAGVTLAGCSQLAGTPHRKAGLWEQTIQTDRSPTPIVTKACFDPATDRRMPILPRGPRRSGACEKFSVTRNGAGYVVDSVCGFGGPGGPKFTSHAVLSGDFSSQYTLTSTINVQNAPDPARNGQHKTTITAVYKGACPPDIQPGQIQLANGDIVDMAALRRGFGGTPGGGGPSGGGPSGGPGGGGQ
jgi:hypothetical protein